MYLGDSGGICILGGANRGEDCVEVVVGVVL